MNDKAVAELAQADRKSKLTFLIQEKVYRARLVDKEYLKSEAAYNKALKIYDRALAQQRKVANKVWERLKKKFEKEYGL